MENDCSISNSFSLYLFLIISVILLSVDCLGLYHIIINWQQSIELPVALFESCIKWQLITRTCFAVFSSLAALSSLILCASLIVNLEIFTEKILSTFLYYNYIIFGPYMLGFCILGLLFWENVSYVCSKHNPDTKFFNSANAFSLIFSLVVSGLITLAVACYKAMNLYIDSILQKPDGLPMIRKMVYWIALRTTSVSELVRSQQNNINRTGAQNPELDMIRIGH